MDDNQILPIFGSTQRNPPFLILTVIIIVNTQCQGVPKYTGGQSKAHLVLRKIGSCFLFVPFKMIDDFGGHALLSCSTFSLHAE